MTLSSRTLAASVSAVALAGLALLTPLPVAGFDLVSALRAGEPATAAQGRGPALAPGERAALALGPGWREAPGTHVAALDIRMAPGWKTYWRVPGEAGVPPHFDWSGSDNLASLEVRWPRPTPFLTYGYTTLGYEQAVTLPLIVRAEDPTRPVSLKLAFSYGLCADICIPAEAELALVLTADGPAGETGRAGIERALSRVAAPAAAAGVAVEACALQAGEGPLRLEAVFRLPDAPRAAPLAVVEGPDSLWFQPAEVRLDGRMLRVTAEVDPYSPALQGGWLSRDGLRVTLLGEDQAVETEACGA